MTSERRRIDADTADGAVAVKAWKNIGMELRRPDGSYVLIDDPLFDPIYRHLAAHYIPMIMHIGARDRVLEKHPDLRVVGAHLASLEHDVREVARRLDRYPNLAVDTSARLPDLLAQNPRTVREFFLSNPDRVLFGTDVVSSSPTSGLTEEARGRLHAQLRTTYELYRRYLETEDVVEAGGERSSGIGLPEEILEKVYVTNAKTWFPALRA